MRGNVIVVLVTLGVAGCLERPALQSGKYLCTASADCDYGWQCVYGLDPQGHGLCIAPDRMPDAGTPGDAAPTRHRGARWTNVSMVRPQAITAIMNLTLSPDYQDGTLVALLTAEPAGAGAVSLRGGTGRQVAPGTYAFADRFVPTTVTATVPGGTLDAGSLPEFTASGFRWELAVFPSQPPLDVRNVQLSGEINAEGIPMSESLATGMYTGCFTRVSAAAIFIEILQQTLDELIQSSGGRTDCDATGHGAPDGYELALQWEATELVDLVDDATACPPGTVWSASAGRCVAADGGVPDGGTVPATGVRWTRFQMFQPEAIAAIANMELPGYYADSSLVVLMAARDPSLSPFEMQGGTGVKQTTGTNTYSFHDTFALNGVPGPVPATKGALNSAGAYPFTMAPGTGEAFAWSLPFLPDQPPLPLSSVSVSGTLDPATTPALLPTSAKPAMAGLLEGCFTPADASQVYLEALSQNLNQLIEGSGGQLDEDCSGAGGAPNGYHLKIAWEADEVVTLVSP